MLVFPWHIVLIFPHFLCSNSVNIYVGIGIPWLIDTAYNFIVYKEPLRVQNAEGLSFSLLVFFCTSVGCIAVLVLRRLTLGAELGGPKLWAWVTSVYFMLLWIIFVVLSSLKVSGIIWKMENILIKISPIFYPYSFPYVLIPYYRLQIRHSFASISESFDLAIARLGRIMMFIQKVLPQY